MFGISCEKKIRAYDHTISHKLKSQVINKLSTLVNKYGYRLGLQTWVTDLGYRLGLQVCNYYTVVT